MTSILRAAFGSSATTGAGPFGGSDTAGAGLIGSSDVVGARPSGSSDILGARPYVSLTQKLTEKELENIKIEK